MTAFFQYMRTAFARGVKASQGESWNDVEIEAAAQLAYPDRDQAPSAERRDGLVEKFHVFRRDAKDADGRKHDGCSYIVLDLTHDKNATLAALAYAATVRADGYGKLADDVRQHVWRLAYTDEELVGMAKRAAATFNEVATTLRARGVRVTANIVSRHDGEEVTVNAYREIVP